MIPLCIQYKKAKAGKMMLFYDPKQNRWLVSKRESFKNFSKLVKKF